jgi:hypothetical protein
MTSADDPGPGNQLPPGWQRVQTLRLAEIVMTILTARNSVPSAMAAAVSRERYGMGFHVQVSLLSDPPPADEAIVVGVVVADFAANLLAPDLDDTFKEKDLIILK